MKRFLYCIILMSLLASFGLHSAKAQGRTYPEPVDMGLSVLWGDQNVVNQYFITQLYYWGGGNGITLRGEEYPSNICSTEYDIATQLYGNGWRMPTADEYRELCEKCSYKCTSDGITFTASNGNSITLPNVGYRYLNMLKNDYTYYWTGTQGFYGFGVLSLYGIDAGSGISWNSINTVINPPRDGVKYYTRFSPDAFGFNSTGIKDKDNICYYLYSDEYQCAIRPVKDRSEPEAIPYAILNNGTLTFYYDSSYNSREGTYYDMDGIRPVRANGLQYNMYLWYDNADDIKAAVFDPSFAAYRPTSRISLLFWQCNNLERITGFENLNMENVTEMNYMFYGCSSLTSLDLSSLNTSKVTGMKHMFNSCSRLKTIYVGNQWSTKNVTSSDGMFYNCLNLMGGQGTKYDSNHTGHEYARIDGGKSRPGYFTEIISCDVNGDGNVDVADIATIIDVMAGKCGAFTRMRADVNGDGSVDVADIATVISRMAEMARQQQKFDK